MYAVIFEVMPKASGKEEYLAIASELRGILQDQEGFVSIERFQSLAEESKILSLSFWEGEEAISRWRNDLQHRAGQRTGRDSLFYSYRIRVAKVIRDYTDADREDAPFDSNVALR